MCDESLLFGDLYRVVDQYINRCSARGVRHCASGLTSFFDVTTDFSNFSTSHGSRVSRGIFPHPSAESLDGSEYNNRTIAFVLRRWLEYFRIIRNGFKFDGSMDPWPGKGTKPERKNGLGASDVRQRSQKIEKII